MELTNDLAAEIEVVYRQEGVLVKTESKAKVFSSPVCPIRNKSLLERVSGEGS